METGQLKQIHKFVNDIKRNLSFKNSHVIIGEAIGHKSYLTHHMTSN